MDSETIFCRYCLQPLRSAQIKFCPHCGKAQPQAEPHQLPPGTVLHDKIIIGPALGEGGFGITYLGRDKNLDIPVAVKEYFPYGFVNRVHTISTEVTCSTDEEKVAFFERGRTRFLQEARVLARFSGKRGIVAVHDFFEENNTAYIVMEFLDGKTLKQYTKEHGTPAPDGKHKMLTPATTLRLLTPVMQSLQLLHKEGVIHRDISPDNIMVMDDDDVKLLDFGAAKVMDGSQRSRSVMLKPGYAPWEQYSSKGDQGPGTDIYALCATIYECVTGQRPPEAPERMVEDPLQPPSALGVHVPKSMEKALIKGLSIYPEGRYQTIADMVRDLEQPDEEDALFTVVYNAGGGAYPPAQQEKAPGEALTLSADAPSGSPVYTLRFDPCGGEAVPALSIPAAFLGWNTAPDGSGVAYAPGDRYQKDADLVLYAVWDAPAVGQLPPTVRGGDTFLGWFTAKSGGSPVSPSQRLTGDLTVFAGWEPAAGKTPETDDVKTIYSGPRADNGAARARNQKKGGAEPVNHGGKTPPPADDTRTIYTPPRENGNPGKRKTGENKADVKMPLRPVPEQKKVPANEERQQKGPAKEISQGKSKKTVIAVLSAVLALAILVPAVIFLPKLIKNRKDNDNDTKSGVASVDTARLTFDKVTGKETATDETDSLSDTLGLDTVRVFSGVTDADVDKWVDELKDNGFTQKQCFGNFFEDEIVLDNAAAKTGYIAGFRYDGDEKTDSFVVLTAEDDAYDFFISFSTDELVRQWSNWNLEGDFYCDGNVVYGGVLDAGGTTHLAKMNVGAGSAEPLYECEPHNIFTMDGQVLYGVIQDGFSEDDPVYTVYQLSDTGDARAILEDAFGVQAYGGQILYTKYESNTARNVYLGDADGSNSRLLLDGNNYYAYAVGNLLFYQADTGDDAPDCEFVYNLLTGETKQVTEITAYGFVTDGTNAYFSTDAAEKSGYYLMHRLDLSSGEDTAFDDHITWIPVFSGGKIYFIDVESHTPACSDNGKTSTLGDDKVDNIFVLKNKLIFVSGSGVSFVDPDGKNPVPVSVSQ